MASFTMMINCSLIKDPFIFCPFPSRWSVYMSQEVEIKGDFHVVITVRKLYSFIRKNLTPSCLPSFRETSQVWQVRWILRTAAPTLTSSSRSSAPASARPSARTSRGWVHSVSLFTQWAGSERCRGDTTYAWYLLPVGGGGFWKLIVSMS